MRRGRKMRGREIRSKMKENGKKVRIMERKMRNNTLRKWVERKY